MKLLIKNATLINPGKPTRANQDILLENGNVVAIGSALEAGDATVFEAEDLHVSPGWIDLRMQQGEPGFESQETIHSACRAAMAGGFTLAACLPVTKPVADNKETATYISYKAQNFAVKLLPIGSITTANDGEHLSEMVDLLHNGVKAFSNGSGCIQNSDILLKSLQYLEPYGGLVMQRPEDARISKFGQMHEGINSTLLGMKGIPSLAEEMIIQRDLSILGYTGGALHFSCVSTAVAVSLIRQAKFNGMKVTADVAAHQLAFIDADLHGFDTNLKVSPPFRSEAHKRAILDGLEDGTIDAIVSDHTPLGPESKDLEFDLATPGISGIETAFSCALQNKGKLSLETLITRFTAGPASVLGLPYPQVEVGKPANLTLFQPNTTWKYTRENAMSKSYNNPFLGQTLTGRVLGVVNGVYSNGIEAQLASN